LTASLLATLLSSSVVLEASTMARWLMFSGLAKAEPVARMDNAKPNAMDFFMF
jgi:hypothetical protein